MFLPRPHPVGPDWKKSVPRQDQNTPSPFHLLHLFQRLLGKQEVPVPAGDEIFKMFFTGSKFIAILFSRQHEHHPLRSSFIIQSPPHETGCGIHVETAASNGAILYQNDIRGWFTRHKLDTHHQTAHNARCIPVWGVLTRKCSSQRSHFCNWRWKFVDNVCRGLHSLHDKLL